MKTIEKIPLKERKVRKSGKTLTSILTARSKVVFLPISLAENVVSKISI